MDTDKRSSPHSPPNLTRTTKQLTFEDGDCDSDDGLVPFEPRSLKNEFGVDGFPSSDSSDIRSSSDCSGGAEEILPQHIERLPKHVKFVIDIESERNRELEKTPRATRNSESLPAVSPMPLPDQNAFGGNSTFTPKRPRSKDSGKQGSTTPCPSTPRRTPRNNKTLSDTKLIYTSALLAQEGDVSFDYLDVIGRGGFSTVYRARNRVDQKLYAVKKSKEQFRSVRHRASLLREVHNLTKLGLHDNILHIYRAWQHEMHLYVQYELCNSSLKGYLETLTEPLPEGVIWSYLADLARGLQCIHSHDMVHFDLKPDNILMGEGSLKIADFGISVELHSLVTKDGEGAETDMIGDCTYLANEVLEGNITKAADMFSLGITVFEMAAHIQLPSSGPLWQRLREGNVSECLSHIMSAPPGPASCVIDEKGTLCSVSSRPNHGPSAPPETSGRRTSNGSGPVSVMRRRHSLCRSTSPGLECLIDQMMDPDPTKRITVEELLRHEMIVQHMGNRECSEPSRDSLHSNLSAPSLKRRLSRSLSFDLERRRICYARTGD